MSLRARWRCRIDFRAIVRRRDFSATWIEDAEGLLFADTVEKLACGLALDFCPFEFARERSH
jgi:hypothetical protein